MASGRSIKDDDNKKYGFFGSISLFFAERPRFTALLMIGIIGFGFLSYTNLIRREGFPSVNLPIAIIQGFYGGEDASVADQLVAQPLEKSISQIPDVESVNTTSSIIGDQLNSISVIASLAEGSNTSAISEELTQAIADANLPKNARVQIIDFDATKFLGEYDMILSVFSTNESSSEFLEQKAGELAPQFTELDSVSTAQVKSLFKTVTSDQTQQELTRQVSFNQVGRITESSTDMQFFNAAVIGITGPTGDNLDIFELSQEVYDKVDEINAQSTDGTMLTVSADFTQAVSGQIDSLQNNVITGIIAILLISTIVIGWRVSAIMSIFVLSVLATTIGILYIVGLTLNVITLFSLVLALGLFVDDATIISEAIDARKRKYKGYRSVIGNAVSSVGSASFAGTMTTILVFFPLLFITGILGEFIIAMPLTIIIALSTSLVLSITLIPWLSRYTILTKKSVTKENPDSIWKIPSKVIKWSATFLSNSIMSLRTGHRVFGYVSATAMLLLSVVFIMGAGYFFSQLGFNIFPPSKDSDELILNIKYDDGTTIEQAQQIAYDADKVMAESVGAELLEVNYGSEALSNTTSATARLELTNFRSRSITSPQLIENLKSDLAAANISGATFTPSQQGPGGPQSTLPFAVQIYSEDPAVLSVAADDMEDYLSNLELTLNNGDTVKVIKTNQGDAGAIYRTDGKRFIQISAGYDSDQVSELLQITRDDIKNEYTTDKLVSLGLSGDQEQDLGFDFGFESSNEESFQSLGPMAMISLVAMFVLLMVQFRSILKPILIFLAIPFSLFGVAFGLYVTSNDLSFFSMIGLIGLIGIVVNNTILLVDAASRFKRQGNDAVQSIAMGLKERFRPLVTTTLTTVVALTPLALSDPFWEPLAVTIIFGLLSSTILVILSFPAYYIVFDVVSEWFSRMFRKAIKR